ncbi:MAG: aminodeoxychorismate synthase component I [Sphingobacteriia bacterium]|nr:aminodeoxychorismate synthase component I [Sphingobacteriia bacterium]
MRKLLNKFVSKVNKLATSGTPFLFVIDFDLRMPEVFTLDELPAGIRFKSPDYSFKETYPVFEKDFYFNFFPPEFDIYCSAFEAVQKEIKKGNTYLINLTFKSLLETSLNLESVFYLSDAKYKLLFGDRFVVFSPETFVEIRDGVISSCPMKGTIDASIPGADEILLGDVKETAEHNTIVDLIRNDLAMVSEDVFVENFRYLDLLHTHKGNLYQLSSRISGTLPKNFKSQLGEILLKLLPAGSITGAPKKKTVEIIRKVENYQRGFYTGIFGVFDGENLNSAVMIRFIENENGQLWFKSGGGITSMSDVEKEYEELIQKIYVPIPRND